MAKKSTTATDATRLKAQRMREEQARKDRRTRNTIIGVVAVLVVAIVVAVALVIVNQRKAQDAAQSEQSGEAAAVLGPFASGAPVLLGPDGVGTSDPSLPTLTEYFDYTCHVCANVDVMVGPQLSEKAESGAFNIAYQPVTTVGMEYQKPSTTASLIVAQKDPEHWVDFHHALLAYFQTQYNGGDGTVINDLDASFAQVKSIAADAGVSQDVISTFTEDAVDAYLTTTTNAWIALDPEGRVEQFGTPEFVRDGTSVITLSGTSADEILGSLTEGMSGSAPESGSGDQSGSSSGE
ncbi:MAG: thioredoxin domain-containing protein [Actinomyces sp.]|jgi:protein-disulfide isomerase|nr:thioredoxin domain-containing protein [Actinomyces sp.]MCI1787912.1 thioredoxin domain-containing protein [Actinomyces sp.]MCI1830956.1 thioredoxin domain-containing protein [Actinomyces sp.]MCI1866327.1 thioredoxin domain-containing protein [Actinomyces sp.]